MATKEFTITANTTLGELTAFIDQAMGIDEPTDAPATTFTPGVAINDGVI